jgi:ubiquinone/menaquinone biosynthesis C-methylase UbiE
MMHNDAGLATPLYRHRFIAAGYDLLNAGLWLPGGSDRLRRRFVDSLMVGSGDRVLELGCGTGLVTRHLCATGAQVTAVDRAEPMVTAARRRAPHARFVMGDVGDVTIEGCFDRVVLGFVLHELTSEARIDVLRRAVGMLSAGGWIGILEWSRPPGRLRGRAWAATVRVIEPPVAYDVLEHGLDDAIAAAGLTIHASRPVAGGRARVVHAEARDGNPAA